MKKKESFQIAVIGIACLYPGAKTPLELWENILARKQQFRQMPDVRLPIAEYYDPNPETADKTYQNKAALIENYSFDWISKKIPKQAFESTDIVHWLTLDTALAALEDAGYTKDKLPSNTTGVIIGNTLTGEFTRSNQMLLRWPYVKKVLKASLKQKGLSRHFESLEPIMQKYYKSVFAPVTEDSLAGGLANTIAGRVCNFLDIHGGGYIVDGACSSSLLAICTAANYLESGQMDMVITGGVDISLDTFELIGFAKTGALTQDEMRVYDKNGKGFLPGEGCGIVVLKRLQDAQRDGDQIYSIINGWGISSDGKGGITAPSSVGQSMALKRAYQKANFNPQNLSFIEGHGTGTTVGDKTEIEGITLALEGCKGRYCGLTSFKSIVGHTKAAAGVGAFIKTVIALNQRILPPTAGIKTSHPIFEEKAFNAYPLRHGQIKDKTDILFAGVSAMGFGGINSHVLLQSGDFPSAKLKPELSELALMVSNQNSEVFFLAGETPEELAKNLEEILQNAKGISYAELSDYASYINHKVNFKHKWRAAIIAQTPTELENKLQILQNSFSKSIFKGSLEEETIIWGESQENIKVGAVFSGQGSQRLNMAYKLIKRFDWAEQLANNLVSPEVKLAIYKFAELAINKEEEEAWKENLKQTQIAQPAIILTCLIWFKYLQKLGVEFDALTGHSLGELMSFYSAGFYDEKTLLDFAAFRGQSMAICGSGSMVSLACDEAKAITLIQKTSHYVSIANLNSPNQTIISGETAGIQEIIQLASLENINATQLPVSAAFHSKLISEAAEAIKQFPFANPIQKPADKPILISSFKAAQLDSEINLNAYFAQQALGKVNFREALQKLNCDILLEIGPGRVLSGLASANGLKCLPVEATAEDDLSLNLLLADLFVRGVNLNISEIYQNRLIRPFIPTVQKEFITNPLERPFPEMPDLEPQTNNLNFETALINSLNLPIAGLENYLSQRKDFLQEVIMADLKHLPKQDKSFSIGKTVSLKSGFEPLKLTKVAEINKTNNNSLQAISTVVYSTIADKTGFPKDKLENSSRLLDDLNLDSIKAGSLLGELSRKYSLQGKIEANNYSNASLEEIINIIYKLTNAQVALPEPNQSLNISEIVLNLTSEKTGFPKNKIQTHFRLLDDLNLDSIKAGTLLNQISKQFNLNGKLEMSGFSNASLDEIIQKVQSFSVSETIIVPTEEPNSKVQSFTAQLIEEELLIEANKMHKLNNLALIYANPLPLELEQAFSVYSDSVQTLHYSQLANLNNNQNNQFEHLIVFMPNSSSDLKETIQILSSTAQFTANQDIQIAFVQAGNGYFGRLDKIHSSYIPSAMAFAASLHLERPQSKIHTLEFHASLKALEVAKLIYQELNTDAVYSCSGYDEFAKRRKIIYDLAISKARPRKAFEISAQDLVLVTGGAKGITAECALAFAQKYNCKMALIGSSPANNEVQNTLAKYSELGLEANYYICNITDEKAVQNLINQLGSIKAVIHGAGLNKPRRVEQVLAEQAYTEISPKLLGAINLLKAIPVEDFKYFIALTSIIGVTGMAGNSWYAFSNEALDLLLRQYNNLETITYAYSIWSEIGMGERMGSTKILANMGINSISPKEGIEQFIYWLDNSTQDQQIVIAAELGEMDTWATTENNFPDTYLEEIADFKPQSELKAFCNLNIKNDKYLLDHNFNGSLLFPTVYALEAMAEAAVYLMEIKNLQNITFENISLLQPIVVESELKIAISAKRLENNKVFIGISTEISDFKQNHFSVEISFNTNDLPQIKPPNYTQPLSLNAQTDLYSWLLFQGESFQNINQIYSLNSQEIVFSVKPNSFAQNKKAYLLGNPLLRDTLLQSTQLLLTDKIYLPLNIQKWTISLNSDSESLVQAGLLEKTETSGLFEVKRFNQKGEIIEQIENYEVKALKPIGKLLKSEEIADTKAIENRIEAKFESFKNLLQKELKFICYKHFENFNTLSADQRHKIEEKVFQQYFPENNITWQKTGKPEINNSNNLQLSISHSNSLLLFAIGQDKQGCDLEFVKKYNWGDLLSEETHMAIAELETIDQNLDKAGTRLWCLKEAVIKAFGALPSKVKIKSKLNDGGIVFVGEANDELFEVLTFPVEIWPNNEAIIGIVTNHSVKELVDELIDSPSWELDFDKLSGKFKHSFNTTFKDCRAFYGKTYFANFPTWMGHLRELVLKPISENLLEDFRGSEYGMVTNFSQLKIYNEAEALNDIEGKIWITPKSDFANSFIDLNFEWFSNGSKLAEGNLGTTWVKIEGHGIVKQSPIPPYFLNYLQKYFIKTESISQNKQINPNYISLENLGKQQYYSAPKPRPEILLSQTTYQTGIHNGNSVGNLYYSNYYDWQAISLEQLLYSLVPDTFKAQGKTGEFICLEANVNHLQEAMPFEEITVKMYLEELCTYGFKLYFEYYSDKRKLAYGNNTIIWAKRQNEKAFPQAHSVPSEIYNYFMKSISAPKQV